MGRLDGKIALITGGARGQGAEEGRLFSAEGATVVLTDVLDEEGERTAAGIERAEYRPLDVRSEAGWAEVVADVVARHGHIDVLVNNAGIDLDRRFEATTLEEFERVVAINQTGVFLGMRTVAAAMIAADRGGSIINISSVAGMEGVRGRAAYASTKWAVRGMTKAAAMDLAAKHIRVNSVHPGPIDTEMMRGRSAEETRARTERIPMKRYGTADEIAGLVLYLLSDDSRFMTGAELTMDGGMTL